MKRILGVLLAGVLSVLGIGVLGIGAGTAYADHDWGGDCDWSGQCYGGDEYRHDYSNHDRNRNRNRERGAFSPDFDRSPVTICMPNSTCHFDGERGQNPDRSGQPR